jgi:hypothetical protein
VIYVHFFQNLTKLGSPINNKALKALLFRIFRQEKAAAHDKKPAARKT